MVEKEAIVWRQYPEYPFIEANQYGQIRIRDRYVGGRGGSKRLYKGHILKQYLDTNGYMQVVFSVNGKLINLRVHRVVAICFLPNPKNLPEVNHIDCDRTNNSVSNLEWVTHQENIAYRDKLGHFVCNLQVATKPVIAIYLETFEVFYFESQRKTSRQLGVDVASINRVLKGLRNKAGGYWFCYVDEKAVENVRAKFGDEVAREVEKLMSETNK